MNTRVPHKCLGDICLVLDDSFWKVSEPKHLISGGGGGVEEVRLASPKKETKSKGLTSNPRLALSHTLHSYVSLI